MCGGAIISDFIGVNSAGRKNFWSELDAYSDLLGLGSTATATTATSKPPPLSDKKGIIF